MKHLITISIILAVLIIPYLTSRYLIFKQKPNDWLDFGYYWIISLSIGLGIFAFISIYVIIYNNIGNIS
jgi:hypothetical protein